MSDSTAIGLATVGCIYLGFFMFLGAIATVVLAIRIISELIQEVINKLKKASKNE